MLKPIDNDADWFFMVGDMTALPALSCKLEKLPINARGYVFIEVMSELDIQNLNVPAGIDIQWIINSHYQQLDKLRSAVCSAE